MLAAFPSPARMDAPLYRTTDIYLSSFLVTRGAAFVNHQRLGPKKTEYRFAANRALHDQLRLYWSGEPVLLVPWHLLATLHRLRCESIVRN